MPQTEADPVKFMFGEIVDQDIGILFDERVD